MITKEDILKNIISKTRNTIKAQSEAFLDICELMECKSAEEYIDKYGDFYAIPFHESKNMKKSELKKLIKEVIFKEESNEEKASKLHNMIIELRANTDKLNKKYGINRK